MEGMGVFIVLFFPFLLAAVMLVGVVLGIIAVQLIVVRRGRPSWRIGLIVGLLVRREWRQHDLDQFLQTLG